jgi:hypothetical protein
MEWTEEHDILMLREMLAINVFSLKKGSVNRGEAWESIKDNLQQINSPQFLVKDKRAIRDRWQLISKKFKAKIRQEECASGIYVEEQTEKEALIEELVNRENTIVAQDSNRASAKKDRESAEEIRKAAMEAMGKKKRKLTDDEEDEHRPAKSRKRCAQPLLEFLQEKAIQDRQIREAELELKKADQLNQANIMKSMLDQQNQLNKNFVKVLNKLLTKDQ